MVQLKHKVSRKKTAEGVGLFLKRNDNVKIKRGTASISKKPKAIEESRIETLPRNARMISEY